MRCRALDRLKAAGFQRVVSLEDRRPAEEPAAGGDPAGAPDRARVRQALAELPASLRVVLELGYFEGLSSSEIATRIAAPVGTVKSRVAAALAKLRSDLGGAWLLTGHLEQELLDFVLGTLSPAAREQAELHLRDCLRCAREVRETEAAMAAIAGPSRRRRLRRAGGSGSSRRLAASPPAKNIWSRERVDLVLRHPRRAGARAFAKGERQGGVGAGTDSGDEPVSSARRASGSRAPTPGWCIFSRGSSSPRTATSARSAR